MDRYKAVIEKFGCKFVGVAHGLVWFTEPVKQSTLATPEIGFSEERVGNRIDGFMAEVQTAKGAASAKSQ
jgi:hypothetical protein